MRALPLFVFISLKHMCIKGIYKGTTTKHSHMGQVGGGGWHSVTSSPYGEKQDSHCGQRISYKGTQLPKIK